MPFFQCHVEGTNAVLDKFHMGFGIDTGAVGEFSAQAVADHVKAVFITNFDKSFGGSTFQGRFHSGTKFEKVVVYEHSRTPGGPSTDLGEADLGALAGISPGNPFPPEVAVCVSLLTDTPGRSGRGRMYLPAPGATTGTNQGKLSGGDQQTLTSWAAGFFGGVNQGSGADYNVVVWSRKTASTHSVTRVRVGDQFDVQRRRQNDSPEVYLTDTVSQV